MRDLDVAKMKERIRASMVVGSEGYTAIPTPKARVYFDAGSLNGHYRVGPGQTRNIGFKVDKLGRVKLNKKDME